MTPLVEAVDGIDLTDPRAVSKALGKMIDESFYASATPPARELVAKLPEGRPTRRNLGGAFDSPAEFDIIDDVELPAPAEPA